MLITKRFRCFIFIYFFLMLVASESTVYGYEYSGYHWPFSGEPMQEPYYINPNSTNEAAGSPERQIAAIQAGARSWNNEGGANFRFQYGGQTSKTLPDDGVTGSKDGYNQIMFAGSNYWYFTDETNGSPHALAVTWIWYNTSTYEISECDMAFNDMKVLSTKEDPDNTQYDIWSIAAHELGHFLKLGHSTDTKATMYAYTGAGEIKERDLHTASNYTGISDDMAGIQYIYGASANTNPVLFNGSASPGTGNENTEFGFYVDYYDANGNAPNIAHVIINGISYNMTLLSGEPANGRYYVKTKLEPLNKHLLSLLTSPLTLQKISPKDSWDIQSELRYNRPNIGEAYTYYFYFEDGQGGNDILPIVQNPAIESPYIGPLVYQSL